MSLADDVVVSENDLLENAYSLIGQGNDNAAAKQLKKLLATCPEHTVAIVLLGLTSKASDHIRDALRVCAQRLEENSNDISTRLAMARLYKADEQYDHALFTYEEYLSLSPKNEEVWRECLLLLTSINQPVKELTCLIKFSIHTELSSEEQRRLNHLAPIIVYDVMSDDLRQGIVDLIKTNKVNAESFSRSIANDLIHSLKLTLKKPKISLNKVQQNELLLVSLPRIRFSNYYIERLLTGLRHAVLHLSINNKPYPIELACAIAMQSHFNEYVMHISDEETAILKRYRRKVLRESSNPVWQPVASQNLLLLLSMYQSLHSLEGKHYLIRYPLPQWPAALQPTAKATLFKIEEEIQRSKTIPQLSEINNSVSKTIQQHYETNPYPRWHSLAEASTSTLAKVIAYNSPDAKKFIPKSYHSDHLEILIAGCGTGRQAVFHAQMYPNANITAIDLSSRSLAYAQNKCDELNIKNISFIQADIAALPKNFGPFDYIECSGVLHHMENPLKGWQALLDILKHNSLMNIALYSQLARRNITREKQTIKEKNFNATPAEIRQHRFELMKNTPEDESLLLFPDFYSLSECRDLLFHEQEQCFNWPQIGKMCDQLNILFCGLWDNGLVQSQFYEYSPDSLDTRSTQRLHEFENHKPDVFSSMYQFMCYKH